MYAFSKGAKMVLGRAKMVLNGSLEKIVIFLKKRLKSTNLMLKYLFHLNSVDKNKYTK